MKETRYKPSLNWLNKQTEQRRGMYSLIEQGGVQTALHPVWRKVLRTESSYLGSTFLDDDFILKKVLPSWW